MASQQNVGVEKNSSFGLQKPKTTHSADFTVAKSRYRSSFSLYNLTYEYNCSICNFGGVLPIKQRKSESHLFKWEDEAILDEVRMVDAKVMDLVHDFQSLSKSVMEQLDSHKTWLLALEAELRSKMNEHMSQMAKSMDEATRQMKEDIDATLSSNMSTTQICDNVPAHNFVAAVAIVGAIACIYWKLL